MAHLHSELWPICKSPEQQRLNITFGEHAVRKARLLSPLAEKKKTCLMPFLHASHMQPKAWRATRRRLCCCEKRRCKCNGGFRATIYFWAYLPRADRWHHVGEECKTAASTSSPRNSNYTFLWTWLQLPWIFGLYTAGQCTLRRYETLSVHASLRETDPTPRKLSLYCMMKRKQKQNTTRRDVKTPFNAWGGCRVLLQSVITKGRHSG